MSTLTEIRDAFLRFAFEIVNFVVGFVLDFIYRDKHEPLPPITNPLLLDSATNLALKIRTKKVRCEDVVQAFITRIGEVNSILNAVVDDRFVDALDEARAVDKLVTSGEKTEKLLEEETPFLGIPFTIKDSYKIKGLRFTAGHIGRKSEIAPDDADVVALMRQAGAIPIAVTNVPELSMWWETNNKVYGRTNNPFDTTRTVGGSSGGEACMLAAAGTVIGLGSDIGGSIRIPAVFNGIFGHKPSKGIVSGKGKYPESPSALLGYSVTGPLCRFASDLVPVFRVLAGSNLDQLKLDEPVDLRKIKIFYMENDGGSPLTSHVDLQIQNAMKKAISHLEVICGNKAQKLSLEYMRYSYPIFYTKYRNGSPHPFEFELGLRKRQINSFLELVKWPLGLSDHTLPAIFLALKGKFPIDKMIPVCDEWIDQLSEKFQTHLEEDAVFLYPTLPTLALRHNHALFCPFNMGYTSIFNILGLPATSCPLGLSSEKIPVGLQVVSWINNDRVTLEVAKELERAFGGWVAPCPVEC